MKLLRLEGVVERMKSWKTGRGRNEVDAKKKLVHRGVAPPRQRQVAVLLYGTPYLQLAIVAPCLGR